MDLIGQVNDLYISPSEGVSGPLWLGSLRVPQSQFVCGDEEKESVSTRNQSLFIQPVCLLTDVARLTV